MAKKNKTVYQDNPDIFQQGLQAVKKLGDFFKLTNRDKRTVKTTQRALKELEKGRTPSEVAKDLGLSTQKYTAIRKKVKEGKAYSPELRDTFREARDTYISTPEKIRVYEPTRKQKGKKATKYGNVTFFPSLNKLEQVTKVEKIKGFTHKDDALKWWRMIVNSGKVVAIVFDEDEDLYYVAGMGERSQRPYKGSIENPTDSNRVSQLIARYQDDDEDDNDYDE